MKILQEGYFSELDAALRLGEPMPKPRGSKPARSVMSIFRDYVNHGRGKECIGEGGRWIGSEAALKRYLAAFLKKFPDYTPIIDTRYVGGEYQSFIQDFRKNGGK